ncbi:hypothetical protein ECEC1862_0258, partial [Escherichia coli EC1862]
TASTNIIPVAV